MDNNSKVIALPGVVVQGQTTPVQSVIDILEEYLEDAKRGDIQGIMIGTVNGEGTITSTWQGEASFNHMFLCSVALHEEAKAIWLGSATLRRVDE